MKRVAALYLPDWSIDRLRRVERPHAPQPERVAADAVSLAPLVAAERANECSVPRGGGWRPGARWARAEVQAQIDALPVHQRPPTRDLGRSSVAAEHPFKSAEVHRQGRPLDASPAPADWAADDAALPPHQRTRFRELGRRSEAAEHPFKGPFVRAMRPDEGSTARGLANGNPRDGCATNQPTPFGLSVSNPCSSSPRKAALRQAQGERNKWGRATPDAPPLVIQHRIGSRVLVAAACRHARALGIAPGMALTAARAQVPELDVRPSEPHEDHASLHALALLLARRWSPVVALDCEGGGDWGLVADISGVAHLFGGEGPMAARLLRMLARAGFRARIAVADTRGVAHGLARHGPTSLILCPPSEGMAMMAPLPVPALRIPPAKVELLRRLGVDTVGQLAAMPRGPLASRFGPETVTRLDQASGTVPEPFEPVTPREAIAVVQRFAEPIASAEAIEHWMGQLVPRLTAALERDGLGVRRLELVAERVDGVPQRIRVGLARASRDGAHLLRLLKRRIEEVEPGYGIDAMALHVRAADPLGPQGLGAELAGDTTPDLAPLVDTLATLGARLWRDAPVESDVPERSVASATPLDPPTPPTRAGKRDDVAQLDRAGAPPPWHPRWPRPARLLARPERLDHVLAALPDQPPKRFTWRGVVHTVVRADGPERIHGEWWRRSGEAAAVRDYFRVEDEAGARFWLYRRGDGERGETGDLSWYLHGAFG